jgi:cell wall-associated NlpC family hydrolase
MPAGQLSSPNPTAHLAGGWGRTPVSDLRSRPLRHALKQAAVTGTTGSLLLGTAVVGVALPAPTAARGTTTGTTQGAPVTIRTQQVASKRKVDVTKEMKTAAAQKGKPYRYGAAGPNAFDCSGFTSYVLKKQGIKLARTAAAQYRHTKRVSHMNAKVGDLVFFYNSSGVYHVGILAGKMKMWHAPHTGTVVKLAKIYGHNWKIGRIV